jgi:ATP-dependent DNA ligase
VDIAFFRSNTAIIANNFQQNIITPVPRRFEMVKHREVKEGTKEARATAISEYFNAAAEKGEEGLVVKDLSSPYILGEKR